MTVIAIGARISAPSPAPSAPIHGSPSSQPLIGRRPITVVPVVMKIGRRRVGPASSSASRIDMPASRFWLQRSISTMALLTTMPASRIRPMNTITETGSENATSAATTPITASGMVSRITSGWSSDSNWQAITT